jgi:pyruvate,water dikinase
MTDLADSLAALAALDDELCTWPDEPRLYTRANGADQWPDPVTPLTQTAVVEPQIRSLPDTYTDRLGLIDRAPVHDCAGIFYGYVAVGLEPTLRMADVMPGWSAQAVGEQYFGLPPDPDWAEPAGGGSRIRTAAVGVRVLRAMRAYPRDARRYEAENRVRWNEARTRDWASVDDGELAAELAFYAAHAPEWRVPLLVSNMIAASAYEQLVKLATHTNGSDGPALAARAMGHIGGIHTNDAIAALRRVNDGSMTRDEWRAEFGFRGPVEYELASRPWGEDDHYLETLLEQSAARGAAALDAGTDSIAARAELRAGAGSRRPLLRGLLRSLEHHLRWRENTKVPEVLGVARLRLAVREAGRRLAERGGIDAADDALFLTRDEVTVDVVLAHPPDRRAAVTRRRAVHQRARDLELPELFLASPGRVAAVPDERIRALGLLPPEPAAAGPATDDGLVLRGIGASPGTVTAPVRVVTDPFTADLEPGEVLVARTTDPAWTPLFLDAAAAVIDLGGPLSHGAVIARELGIPCVINVKDGSARLATGQVVVVDGSSGEVRPVPADGLSAQAPPA